MTKNRPLVSLFVPAYNAAETLPACLEAIAGQTYQACEMIVVDDGSTDCTARIAERAGVRLIRHPQNRGLAAARNTAFRAARGDLVAALDSDLVASRDWLARMVRNFEGRRRIGGCCGRVIEKHTRTIADRWRSVHMKLDFGNRRSYKPRWLFCGISLIRRQAILEAGFFDERCRAAYDDVDMSQRLKAGGHSLLYDPTATARHLKRSRPGNVVRGFWSYWAARNEMQGAYKSLAAAAKLMVERQMGIAAYRIEQDLRHKRDELLPLDLLIPLTFCVRDLDDMVRLGTLADTAAKAIEVALVEQTLALWHKRFDLPPPFSFACLAFPQGSAPNPRSHRLSTPARRYVNVFAASHEAMLGGLSESVRHRLTRHLPAVLSEAGM